MHATPAPCNTRIGQDQTCVRSAFDTLESFGVKKCFCFLALRVFGVDLIARFGGLNPAHLPTFTDQFLLQQLAGLPFSFGISWALHVAMGKSRQRRHQHSSAKALRERKEAFHEKTRFKFVQLRHPGRKSFFNQRVCILMRIIRNWKESLKKPDRRQGQCGRKKGGCARPAMNPQRPDKIRKI